MSCDRKIEINLLSLLSFSNFFEEKYDCITNLKIKIGHYISCGNFIFHFIFHFIFIHNLLKLRFYASRNITIWQKK